jgi:hypothetical protein
MRNMSFSHTVREMQEQTKTVTRRIGWERLKPGTYLRAVRKARGLKKGEKIQPLGVIQALTVRRETLGDVTEEEVRREGFPGMSVGDFQYLFKRVNDLFHTRPHQRPDDIPLTRIAFRHVPPYEAAVVEAAERNKR